MTYGPQHITDSLRSDFDEIIATSQIEFLRIVNSEVIITGATGFVGTWLTLSWVYARKLFQGNGRLIVTSRSAQQIRPMVEAIDSGAPVEYLASDITMFQFPSDFHEGFVLHAATPASASMNSANPAAMLDVIIDGQRRIIAECVRTQSRLLFLSSGAVYGRQPLDLEELPETWEGAPDITRSQSAYHEGKRVAELMASIAHDKQGLNHVTARLFAFLAPFLPFDTHFAAGNFIKDALDGASISIQSGGESTRSYQYATDMVSWLWKLLLDGQSGQAYNVGSHESVTIKELATAIANEVQGAGNVLVLGKDEPSSISRYVPSVVKIESELGLRNRVDLVTAIRRTAMWARQSNERDTNEH